MKLERNKIVFAGVILILLLFLGSYGYMLTQDEEETDTLTQPELPHWEEPETEYSSKLEAIEALKEEREVVPPAVYPEHIMDDKGYFNPDYMEYEKQRIIDSIEGQRNYQSNYQYDFEKETHAAVELDTITKELPIVQKPVALIGELTLNHQLFFASKPKLQHSPNHTSLLVAVDGEQLLRKDSRIQLRLLGAVRLETQYFPKNTLLFGRVRFQPNRVLIQVAHISNTPLDVEAYDLQDGMPGLYLENSLRAEATQELKEDVVQDINIAGLPQVRGLKNVFQRRQRNLKVTVLDGHRLLLQSKEKTQ